MPLIANFTGSGSSAGVADSLTQSIILSGGGPPYDPATDPAFVAIWEADSNVASTAGAVYSWTDRVAAIIASQAIGSHQPTVVPNVINGLPTTRWSNASAYEVLTPPATNILSNGAFSIYIIIRPTLAGVAAYGGAMGLTFPMVANTKGMIFFSSSPVGSGSYGPGPFWGGNPGGAGGWPTTFGGYVPTAFTYNTTTFDVWSIQYSGGGLGTIGNWAFLQNGNSLPLMINFNGLFDPTANALGDYDVNGANSFNGDIAAIYITNQILTTTLSQFQTYILNKWGLTT